MRCSLSLIYQLRPDRRSLVILPATAPGVLTQDKELHDAITTHEAEPASPPTLDCFLFRSAGMGRLGWLARLIATLLITSASCGNFAALRSAIDLSLMGGQVHAS